MRYYFGIMINSCRKGCINVNNTFFTIFGLLCLLLFVTELKFTIRTKSENNHAKYSFSKDFSQYPNSLTYVIWLLHGHFRKTLRRFLNNTQEQKFGERLVWYKQVVESINIWRAGTVKGCEKIVCYRRILSSIYTI